jgi:CBS domain-containing protein
MSVGQICTRTVITAKPDETARAAADRMLHYNVGSLVVVDNNKPVGILTDRDLVLRVMARGDDPDAVNITSIMTTKPVCVQEQTPLEDAMNLLRGYQIRRLIVVNQAQELIGIFALDDMLEMLGEEQQAIAALMRTTRTLHKL